MLITIGSNMNTRYLVIIATITVMLVGATALATTDNVFAGKKKYEKSQASISSQ